ncbi:MAG: malate dehydrogenase [Candidatus Omnitrophica bacterium CG1_02_46_14]|nr:MAG: malate dehydrogenase [Candidatus Omnitrophica bacterium CG1_02_46_14]
MKIRNPFVSIIGAGQVGATTAQRILEKNLSDVVLFDVVPGLPQGKALDLMEAAPIEGHEKHIIGTNDYKDIEGSDIVVVTAGLPRKPGMTREDLLALNAKIVTEVCVNIKKYAPNSKVIVVTNPLDIMTFLAYKVTGFSEKRILGMAGVLDTARMRYFIAEHTDCVPREVTAVVLGGHGDLMVPVSSHSKVNGKPVKTLIPLPELTQIEQRTKDGGAEIVALLKTGSAFYAPASSVCEMVKAILKNEKKTLPVCAYLHGEYGVHDAYFGVPAILGKDGVEKVVEISLSDAEKMSLTLSAEKVKQGIAEVVRLGLHDLTTSFRGGLQPK